MSDRLPGPAQTDGQGGRPATPARSFRRVGSLPMGGPSEADMIAEIARRRQAAPLARQPQGAAPAQPAAHTPVGEPAAAPVATQAPGFSPLSSMIDQTGAPATGAPNVATSDPVYSVLIGGQPQQLPLSEIIRGYMRQQDYTAKTTQAAEQLRVAQGAHQAFDQARLALEARLPAILAAYGDEFTKPIDWVQEQKTDPMGFMAKHARWLAFSAARTEADNLAALRAREDFARKQEMKRLGHEFLMSVLPGWRDPATRQQLQALQLQHLRELGYQQDELDAYEMLDPRQVVILEESRRFRALVAAHPELLRTPDIWPSSPQARGDTPRATGGNGRDFSREPASTSDAARIERQWAEMQDRSGYGARETAIALIGARRRASGINGAAPLRRNPGRF